MKCPTCKETKLLITERKGIEIDYCPECRGIWLDRGELDKLLEKAREQEAIADRSPPPAQQPPPQAQPQPQPHYQQQPYPQHAPYPGGYYGKPYKRKKSFLEELFD